MSPASRVARRFIAEALTKEWLMGIRRGWLQLMKPNITSWNDVMQAIGQLRTFVINLREQIQYTRPIAKRLIDEKFEPKINKALGQLETALKDAQGRAQHWREVDEDPETYGRGTFSKADGEHMFRLFRDDFYEASNTSEPLRGGGGRHRSVDLTELLDRVLKLLREDAEFVRKYDEANPESPFQTDTAPKEFALGEVKAVVVDDTLKGTTIHAYIKYLDRAQALLKQKGLGKVWYGVVFIEGQHHKKTPEEMSRAKEYGYSSSASAGEYRSGPNEVYVQQPPGPYVTETTVHELGHRYWFKVMKPEQRARFNSLVRTKETEKQRDYPQGPVTEEGEYKPIFPVSVYGRSNIEEAFAEAFERYVLDGNITRPQVEALRSVLARQRNYRYDDRRLRQLNDPSGREEGMQLDGGYEVWHVEIVPIRDIHVPQVWQPQRFEEAKALMEKGVPLDPIRATKEGGKWEISDGIHRTNASIALGYTHVPVMVPTWVATPEAKVEEPPEKPKLPLGTWVKLHKPLDGKQIGWAREYLRAGNFRGVRRHWYNIALVKPDDTWPDQGDFKDTEFEIIRPPSWGPEIQAAVEGR